MVKMKILMKKMKKPKETNEGITKEETAETHPNENVKETE